MKQREYTSEVAHLRQQMELECAAMHLALKGVAAVARHAVIAHRHRALDSYQEQLEQVVGYQQALQISIDIYDRATAYQQEVQDGDE